MIESVFRDCRQPHKIRSGPRPKKDIRALGHLVAPDIGNNQPLAMKLMGSLDPRGHDGMRFSGVRPNNNDERGMMNVLDATPIARISYCTKKPFGRWRLAIP